MAEQLQMLHEQALHPSHGWLAARIILAQSCQHILELDGCLVHLLAACEDVRIAFRMWGAYVCNLCVMVCIVLYHAMMFGTCVLRMIFRMASLHKRESLEFHLWWPVGGAAKQLAHVLSVVVKFVLTRLRRGRVYFGWLGLMVDQIGVLSNKGVVCINLQVWPANVRRLWVMFILIYTRVV